MPNNREMTQFQRHVHQISYSFCYYWVVLVQLSLSTEFASCKIFARDGSHCFHDVKGFIFFLAIFLQDSKWSEETKKERNHWHVVNTRPVWRLFSAEISVDWRRTWYGKTKPLLKVRLRLSHKKARASELRLISFQSSIVAEMSRCMINCHGKKTCVHC